MLCALIMAGGKGERFWPLSTDNKPKQFLNLLGEESMLQMTVNRLKMLIPLENIFIVTAKNYVDLVKEQLPELQLKNIIVEPVGKNTAPCIGLAAMLIDKQFKDATLVVVPSDQLVLDTESFIKSIESAEAFINDVNDSIVTIGIKPNRPETGYGYIKYDRTNCVFENSKVKNVLGFVEKPDHEKALKYLTEGSYLWNSGIFIWKISTILNLTEKHLNETYSILREIAISSEAEYEIKLHENYVRINSISVDYGIMEKADNIYVIPSDFGWDDVGSWYSLERYREKDIFDNIIIGNVTSINSNNNIIVGNKKPIIIADQDDIFVVETEDVILIGKKDSINKIKDIKQKYDI